MASIGTVIDGKYEIIAVIGKGGMSTVYLAMDRRLNKQWAVKEAVRKPGANSNIYELTPIAEANLLKSLDHPNIVRIVDIIEQGGYIYIVEDFVEGKSLAEEIKRGPSSPDDVVNWGVQICDIFEYLHSRPQPIIYRDMKPANVQLQPDRKTIKLLDFGIAKTYKPQNVSDTMNLGTRGYAAPEQFDVKRQSDARTDIYSLGVTLRALLMGKTPYDVEFYDDITKQNRMVTDGLIKVLKKATDQNPANRYQSAAEFKHALLHYHDRDEAVIRLRKRKLNSFRATIAASLAFIIIGTALLPISSVVKKHSYQEKIDNKNYIEAVEIDKENPEAYELKVEAMKSELSSNKNTINNLSDSFGPNGDFNYRNINKKEDERKKNIGLEVALLVESGESPIDFDVATKYSMPYWIDLAYNFEKTESAVTESTDMSKEITNSTDIYEATGKIKLYYAAVYNFCKKNSNKAESVNVDAIITQLSFIKSYLVDNKSRFTDEKLNQLVKNHANNLDGIVSLYEYLFKSQYDCISYSVNNQVLVKDNEEDNIYNSCLSDDSEFIRNNKYAKTNISSEED